MKKMLNDDELKKWFLEFCKENKGCYIMTEDEKEEQDYQKEYIIELLNDLEVYEYMGDYCEQELVSLDEVKELVKKCFELPEV